MTLKVRRPSVRSIALVFNIFSMSHLTPKQSEFTLDDALPKNQKHEMSLAPSEPLSGSHSLRWIPRSPPKNCDHWVWTQWAWVISVFSFSVFGSLSS